MKIPRFFSRFQGWNFVSRTIIAILTLGWARAITIFPFIFYMNEYVMRNSLIRNHEITHLHQQRECGMVGIILYLLIGLVLNSWIYALPAIFLFYILYLLNWLINIPRFGKQAYKMISFEQEAKLNANIYGYYVLRRPFDWIKYIT